MAAFLQMARVSASVSCARAISSKSIPSMAATENEAATFGMSRSGESGGQSSTVARERLSATTLSFPAIHRMSVVYSEMFDSCVV